MRITSTITSKKKNSEGNGNVIMISKRKLTIRVGSMFAKRTKKSLGKMPMDTTTKKKKKSSRSSMKI